MNEKKEAMRYLKSAQGQLSAAVTMLDDDRYCIDVSHQILASIALLKKANEKLLRQHMTNCVIEAFETDQGEAKIEEVLKLVSKMID